MATPEIPVARLRSANRLPSGWAALDHLLGGGWPVGKLVEIRGRGCTSLALSAVRRAQAESQVRDLPVAWIDGAGVFCPATACVDPARLTLVQAHVGGTRRAPASPALFAADILLRSRAYTLLVLDLAARRMPPTSVWFRLARLAAHAHTSLLLLHSRSGEHIGECAGALSGSASALLIDVRLCPVQGSEWSEWMPSDLEVQLQRNRAGDNISKASAPLRLPALG